jgi:phosphoglycolate phosphatase
MHHPVLAAADTVAFDMDGTLVDSTATAVEGARAGLARFFRERGVDAPIPGAEVIRPLIGMPSLQYFAALVPERFRPEAETVRAFVGAEEVRLIRAGATRPFPGTLATLDELRERGYRLVLVSNSGSPYFAAVRQACALDGRFDRAYCLGDAPSKTEGLRRALRELGTRSGAMVGDKRYDLDAGRAAGLAFIGCRYGFGLDGELDGADALIDDIREVAALLPGRAT